MLPARGARRGTRGRHLDPERDLTLVVLVNIQATPAGVGAADLMARALMDALYGG